MLPNMCIYHPPVLFVIGDAIKNVDFIVVMQSSRSKNTYGKFSGCLLKNMDGDSDSDMPEFSLPPKSIVKRPRKSAKKRSSSKWHKYYRMCCRYCSTTLFALVLVACVLSIVLLFWFSLRQYRDIQNLSRRLAIEINKVQAEQTETVAKCSMLGLNVGENDKKDQITRTTLNYIKNQLSISTSKMKEMNNTLVNVLKELHSGDNKVMLKTKVDALQKGMADSGAEMTKLSDQLKQVEQQTNMQSSIVAQIHLGLWNISKTLVNTTGASAEFYDGAKVDLNALLDSGKDNRNEEDSDTKLPSLQNSDAIRLVHNINDTLSFKILQIQSAMLTNSHYHNLTQLFSGKTLEQITINADRITLLWKQLVKQNRTILNIQQRLHPGYSRDLYDVEEGLSEPIASNSEAPMDSNARETTSDDNSYTTGGSSTSYVHPIRRRKKMDLYGDMMDID